MTMLYVSVVAQTGINISKSIINIDGESYYVHTVGQVLKILAKFDAKQKLSAKKNAPRVAFDAKCQRILFIPIAILISRLRNNNDVCGGY